MDATRAMRENDKRIEEAAAAVRSGSAGKNRAEVRQLLLDEFRSRSVDPPSATHVNLMADSIVRFGEQTARGRTGAVRDLASFAGDMAAIFRLFKNDMPVKVGVIVTDPTGREPYYPSPASAPAGI